MENNQLNTVEATIARFTDIAEAEHLPFGTQQGWTSSQYYMTSYLREHADNPVGRAKSPTRGRVKIPHLLTA